MVEQNTLRLEVAAMYRNNNLKYLVGDKDVSNFSLPPFENIICDFFIINSELIYFNFLNRGNRYEIIKSLLIYICFSFLIMQ